MIVYLNNEQTETNCKTLQDLLVEKGIAEKQGIAVALNEEVVPRNHWTKSGLNTNDKILVITATQGG